MEEKYYNVVKKLLDYDIEDVKIMVEIGILSRKMGKYYKMDENCVSHERFLLEEENSQLKKTNYELEQEKNSIKNQFYVENEKKRAQMEEKMQKEIQNYKDQFQQMISLQEKSIEARVNDRISIMREKASLQEGKIELLKKNIEEKQNEIEILQKKYVLSTKGKEFETDIYNNLKQIIGEKYNNIWLITHVGSKLGSKGDIIVEHRITKIRIMIDPKNHEKVPSPHRNKFINDMKNVNNQFHGGIMVARGNIDTKRSFDREMVGEKPLLYISHYRVGTEEFLMMQIESLHQSLLYNETNIVSKKNIQKKYVVDYNELKQQKILVERQQKYIVTKMEKLSKEYSTYFEGDIEVDIVNSSDVQTQLDETNYIMEFLTKSVKVNKNKHCKVSNVKAEIEKLLPDISAKKVTTCINNWKKQMFKDDKKITSRSTLVGYELIV